MSPAPTDDLHKGSLLRYLCGTICPGCGEPKPEYQWTCVACQTRFKNSPQHHALSEVCDDHIHHAMRYVGYVRASLASS
jgi:hypothetical protein